MSDSNHPPKVSKPEWPEILGFISFVAAIFHAFSHTKSMTGTTIWLALMVGLPAWLLFTTKNQTFKKAMAGVLLFSAFVTIAPSNPSSPGPSCHTEWDGHNNPTVCD